MVAAVTSATVARLRVVLVLLAGVVLQTTFGADLRVLGVAPDLMLLLAVAGGLSCGPEAGAVIGFCAGLLADLSLTTTPMGLFALSWCLVGFVVGWARTNFLPEGRPVEPLVGFVATLGGIGVYLAVGDLAGQSSILTMGPHWLLRVALIEAGWNALLAVPAAWLMRRAARGLRSADRLGRTDALASG